MNQPDAAMPFFIWMKILIIIHLFFLIEDILLKKLLSVDESNVTDQPMDLLQRNMNKSTEDESIMNENSVKESAGHPGVKSGKPLIRNRYNRTDLIL